MTDRLASTTPLPVPEDEVERVARAISAHTYATTVGNTDCAEWEDMAPSDRVIYRNAARAAIQALSSTPGRDTFALALAMRKACVEAVSEGRPGNPEDDWSEYACTKDRVLRHAVSRIEAIDPASLVLSPQEPAVTK